MFNALIAILLALAVFLGGGGATVYAAQDSLPDQALYPLKIFSEDTLLSLTESPQARINYEMDFADRRLAEMTRLLAGGNTIPESLVDRLQNQLDAALRLAAGMDDAEMLRGLEQVRLRSETQLQVLGMLAASAPQSARPALQMAQMRIQEQVQLSALGQADPQEFRLQVMLRMQYQGGTDTSIPGQGNGGGRMGPTSAPGQGSGGGMMGPTTTPMPTMQGNGSGSGTPGGMGPGMMPGSTQQPGSGSGNGP